jgi:excisionase family DNA binding protein
VPCMVPSVFLCAEEVEKGPQGGKEKWLMETVRVAEVEQTYFRPEEAAEYLRVGRTTMYALLSSKAIPSVKEGRTRIIRKADLDAYIEDKLAEAK